MLKKIKLIGLTVAVCSFLMTGLVGKAGAAGDHEGKVMWYTVLPTEGAVALVREFNAVHPDLEVQIVRSGSYAQVKRYTEELNAGKDSADLLQHNAVDVFNQWARDGLLAKHNSPEASHYPLGVQFPDYWVALRAFVTVLAYNPNKISKPTSWLDLLNSENKGRIVMADPRTAGDALALYYQLRNLHGADYQRKLGQQGVTFQEGVVRMAEQISSGEKWIGTNVGYRVVNFRDEKGAPIDMVFPEEGTQVLASPLAIAVNAPHPKAASILFNWLLSADGQKAVTSVLKQMSVRIGAEPTPGLPPIDGIKILPIDNDQLGAVADDMRKEFAEFYGLN
jgi:iron(III) transport system substrate-binding protein